MASHPSQTTEPDQNKAEPRELSPSGSAQGTLALSLPLLTGKFFTTEPSAKPLALSLPTPPVCQQLPGAWRAPGGVVVSCGTQERSRPSHGRRERTEVMGARPLSELCLRGSTPGEVCSLRLLVTQPSGIWTTWHLQGLPDSHPPLTAH